MQVPLTQWVTLRFEAIWILHLLIDAVARWEIAGTSLIANIGARAVLIQGYIMGTRTLLMYTHANTSMRAVMFWLSL